MVRTSSDGIKKVSPEELIGRLNDVEIKYAPKELFLIGNQSLVSDRCISIVGTRSPSAKGVLNAKKITKFLVKNDVTIVSGLAKGIDTIAHKTAIKENGKTIAVIGTPLDKFYPKENKELQEKIMNDFLVISQFDLNSPVYPSNFPARNRTMALISQSTVIIEAGEKTGTMHQGWEALRLGRELFILDSIVNDKKLSWPKKLIEYGARVLSVDDLEILLDNLPEKISFSGSANRGDEIVSF